VHTASVEVKAAAKESGKDSSKSSKPGGERNLSPQKRN
jgi:hypothetical protein